MGNEYCVNCVLYFQVIVRPDSSWTWLIACVTSVREDRISRIAGRRSVYRALLATPHTTPGLLTGSIVSVSLTVYYESCAVSYTTYNTGSIDGIDCICKFNCLIWTLHVVSICIEKYHWYRNLTSKHITVFVPIEARRASAGITPSETVLISRENNCDRNTTYPLYITSFHCYMTYWSKSVQNATYLIVK